MALYSLFEAMQWFPLNKIDMVMNPWPHLVRGEGQHLAGVVCEPNHLCLSDGCEVSLQVTVVLHPGDTRQCVAV